MGANGYDLNGKGLFEICTGLNQIQRNILDKVQKSICRIKLINEDKVINGSGFFMKISDIKNCLITNYSIISQDIKANIEIEIYNKKTMNLKLNRRYIKYFPEPKDITIIEIRSSDEIFEDIEFLNFDLNYKFGYNIYENIEVFSLENPFNENPSYSIGKIINIKDYEFEHNISTDDNSLGYPIMLINNNVNIIQVIGIHKEWNKSKEFNLGTFIGEIFNEDLNKNNNYIIAEIDIKESDVKKNIRIINSYEEYQRNNNPNKNIEKDEMNEEDIKKCKIKINNKLIPFNYFYKFENVGKYTIKYSFKIYLTKTSYLFSSCDSITKIDLSNFNTQIVTNMHCMFSQCQSLSNINLSNFYTNKVTDMGWMFWCCKSLTKIDLSKFNTINVISMLGMFSYCESLTSLDLSNFDTRNVKYMWNMFEGCKSLKNVNLCNFNTQKVVNIGRLFFGCESLTNVNLSNFNTKNVKEMNHLFFGCKSLTNININNFDTQNVTNMKSMFYSCESLTNIDLNNFKTQNVTDMSYMFYGCKNLRNLDLSNFDTQNVNNMFDMFEKCDTLNKENLTNFIPPTVTDEDEEEDNKSIKIENIILKDKNEEHSISQNSN